MPAGRNCHDSVSRVPPSTASKVKPQRTQDPPTTKANSRPRSATATCDRVSHTRIGVWLRPVNQLPTRGPAPASHQQARQTGLHCPVRVTSDTRS